jgi:hypothetical protein
VTRSIARRNSAGDAFVSTVDFLKENPLLLLAGLSAMAVGGVSIWWLIRARSMTGDRVVIYTASGTGASEFRTAAQRISQRIGAYLYAANNAQDVLDAVRQHRRIQRLVLVGHGTTTEFVRPGTAGIRVGSDALPTWMSVQTFSREVGPRMARNGIIGWAGCSAASNPGQSSWSYQSYGPCGDNSFIGHVRDAMVQIPGIASGIEHRGHAAAGHTTANPSARSCLVDRDQVGQCCASVMDSQWGANAYQQYSQQWASLFEGTPSEYWISGDDVHVSMPAEVATRYA